MQFLKVAFGGFFFFAGSTLKGADEQWGVSKTTLIQRCYELRTMFYSHYTKSEFSAFCLEPANQHELAIQIRSNRPANVGRQKYFEPEVRDMAIMALDNRDCAGVGCSRAIDY